MCNICVSDGTTMQEFDFNTACFLDTKVSCTACKDGDLRGRGIFWVQLLALQFTDLFHSVIP
jgi:hypothetical protein